MDISKIVENKILETIESFGCEIAEINYQKSKNDVPTLWIYIYHESGVDLDLLSKINEVISPILDDVEELSDKYNLNLSSPGIDRAFKSQRDYERNYEKEVELRFYAPYMGKKIINGTLKKYDGDHVTIICENEELVIDTKSISKISQYIKF